MNYCDYFIHSTRVNGTAYTHLSDDAPDCLRDFIRSVHFDHFFDLPPNDWIYAQIFDAFENDPQIDPEPDIYNHDLTKWLSEYGNSFAISMCNEAVEQMGCGAPEDIISFISNGQLFALQRIHDAVREFLDNAGDE